MSTRQINILLLYKLRLRCDFNGEYAIGAQIKGVR